MKRLTLSMCLTLTLAFLAGTLPPPTEAQTTHTYRRSYRHSHVSRNTGNRYYHTHSGSVGHRHTGLTYTTRTRFVRRDFNFTGRVRHDTNLFRRSIVIDSSDGIRRRIDVPRDIRVIDGRTGKL